jgi:hypothetical protein
MGTTPESAVSLAAVPQRIGALVDLLTSLDTRIIAALDGLEEMRATMGTVDELTADADHLVSDIQERIARFDARLDRDLNEIKETIVAKLGEIDVAGIGSRFERLEEAVFNIERATLNLDRIMEGALESMPDFVAKRVRAEGVKKTPRPAADKSG